MLTKFGMQMRLDPLGSNNQYNFAVSKIQHVGGGHLENLKKLQYLRNGTTDLDEIW